MDAKGGKTSTGAPNKDPPYHHVLIGTSTSVCRCPYLSAVHTPNPTISFLSVDCCLLPSHLVFTPSLASGEFPVTDPSPGNTFVTHVMSFCSFCVPSHLLSHHPMFIFEFVSLFWLLLSSLSVRRTNGSRGVLRHNAHYGCGYVPLVIRWATVNGYENASATLRKFTYATALRPWRRYHEGAGVSGVCIGVE